MADANKLDASASGEFVRKVSSFRNWISRDGSTSFPAESGRYHLYVANQCPWAHRTMVTRKLKGLEDAISMDIAHFRRDEKGWKFFPVISGCTPDTLYGFSHLKDVYLLSDKDYQGRISVPVLWDKKTKTVVNNESSEIIQMLNSEFNDFCKTEEQRAMDLYPEHLRKEIDSINEWVYRDINNGVYRAGFSSKQEPYDRAVREVFAALDRVEEILSRQRYLAGSQLTLADVRLYTTLARFDPVYVGTFKCNKKRIVDYPNLWGYLRDLYHTPGFGETTNRFFIENGYQGTNVRNPHGIVAIGPDINYDEPHDRATQFSQ